MFRTGKPRTVAQRLAALPSGTHVRLRYGAVFVKMAHRWLPAGVIDKPTSGKALLRLNLGALPVVLQAAAGTKFREAA